jgi:hypothetical protein
VFGLELFYLSKPAHSSQRAFISELWAGLSFNFSGLRETIIPSLKKKRETIIVLNIIQNAEHYIKNQYVVVCALSRRERFIITTRHVVPLLP